MVRTKGPGCVQNAAAIYRTISNHVEFPSPRRRSLVALRAQGRRMFCTSPRDAMLARYAIVM